MTKQKLISKEQQDQMSHAAAAHAVWRDKGLEDLRDKSPAVFAAISSMNRNVETHGYSSPWDDFLMMMNQGAGVFSNGKLLGRIFECVLEHDANPETVDDPELKGYTLYPYSGKPFPDSEHIEMNVLVPHGVKIMETVVHKAKDGTETPVLVNLCLRPVVPAHLNGGKELMSSNWEDKVGMKKQSQWNRLFGVWTADLIGVEGIRITIQRICTLIRNEGKELGYSMSSGDRAAEFRKNNQVNIQLKERQILKHLLGSMRVAMDKFVARKEWEFHFDRTLSPQTIENRRLALSSRFDTENAPSAVPGNPNYCEYYAQLTSIMQNVDENGRRDVQGVIDILEAIMDKPFKVKCHVSFVSQATAVIKKELQNCRAGRAWNENEESMSAQAAKSSSSVEMDVSCVVDDFFSNFSVVGSNGLMKEGSEMKPLNKPEDMQAVKVGASKEA